MKLNILLRLMIVMLFSKESFSTETIVGIWAQPNRVNPIILWYFYPDGSAKASTNNGYNTFGLQWMSINSLLALRTTTKDHKWGNDINDGRSTGFHSYQAENGRKHNIWEIEKISSNPDKLINFYSVCINANKTLEVVNVGKFMPCGALPSKLKNISSYTYKKARKLCLALFRKQKINTTLQNGCLHKATFSKVSNIRIY